MALKSYGEDIPQIEYKKQKKSLTLEAKKALIIAALLAVGAGTAYTGVQIKEAGIRKDFFNDNKETISMLRNYQMTAENKGTYIYNTGDIEKNLFIEYYYVCKMDLSYQYDYEQLDNVVRAIGERARNNANNDSAFPFNTFDEYYKSLGYSSVKEYVNGESQKYVFSNDATLAYDYDKNEAVIRS